MLEADILPNRSSGSHSNLVKKSVQSRDTFGFVGKRKVSRQLRLDTSRISILFFRDRLRPQQRRDSSHSHLLPGQMALWIPTFSDRRYTLNWDQDVRSC
jgi:hypothetical protein